MTHGTTSLGQFIEFQAAVLRQLPRPEDFDQAGVDVQDWTNNQASMKRALASVFLPPVPIVHEPVRQFQVWKTLTLRGGWHTSTYETEIKGKRLGIHWMWTDNCMCSKEFIVVRHDTKVDLCLTTIKELTGKDEARFEDYFMATEELGQLCHCQVGPELRLEYKNQPMEEMLLIAMQPLPDSSNNFYSFAVARDNSGLRLRKFYHKHDGTYQGNQKIVIATPRNN